MAATDKPYRNQKTLDIVFGVTCLLMLVSLIWMFADDYVKKWKTAQRDFRDVEEAVAEQAMLKRLPDESHMSAIREAMKRVKDASQNVAKAKEAAGKDAASLFKEQAKAEADFAGLKATYDSKASLYDIEVEKLGHATEATRPTYAGRVADRKKELDGLKQELDKRLLDLETINTKLKVALKDQTAAEKELADAQDALKRMTGDFDRFAKNAAQKRWKTGDWFRSLPVIEAFASPLKIQQYTLDELPIDYSFKRVTRYDRCTTCHLGYDRASFDEATLRGLGQAPEGVEARLKEAKKLLRERQDDGETLGFDPSDIPDKVRQLKLTDAQIKQYAAHPHLELFVDSNSPHPAEKFGCSICHGGQGSATDFALAAHTPNDAKAKHDWEHHLGWEASHYWDFPMLPTRFNEAGCVKCHHQLTDLTHAAAKSDLREGKAIPGPGAKVLRGYNLVRENGCFGCHEIAGIKSGRAVGPDLRLEPNPPLDDLTATERNEVLSDAQNPPGAMRKVGPSLYRLSEKTNQEWTRKWIQAPRDFRPDTKMPHFYGLSNNRKDVLPDDQKDFPDAEIASITYYLLRESADYLHGKDKYRLTNELRLKELEAKQQNKETSDAERKELVLLQRRLEQAKLPTPLSDAHITNSEGKIVSLPEAAKGEEAKAQVAMGRHLFTIKGCLACHTHKEAAVVSDSNFGPNLSRLAAKINPDLDPDKPAAGADRQAARRRWLIQWILNPNVHSPRTRMPVTQLTETQAAAIASWLLSQEVSDWGEADVPAAKSEALTELARLYLVKAAGLTRQDVKDILESAGDGKRKGIPKDRIQYMVFDADERELIEGTVDDNKLKWYIGKKSISRMGCFGCHNIPGFEWSKPIGTPLNDWGKKDPERIAFEDINAYVKEHYYAVDSLTDKDGHGLKAKDGKEPYDSFFTEAMEHHSREGFLYQKLNEPRSYDYNRLRAWDDRLRMPQFKFARDQQVKPLEGESDEQAQVRAEAEAREAVMTFVLGLVAEPVPLKYVNSPTGDHMAEVKGLHVLEKFNCAGCHQLRSGVYEFKVPEDGQATEESVLGVLKAKVDNPRFQRQSLDPDYGDAFKNHNAWTGLPQARPNRLTVHGLPSAGAPPGEILQLRLTDALRFSVANEKGGKTDRNIPAAEEIGLPREQLAEQAEPHGGVLANLLVPYLTRANFPDSIKRTLPDIGGDKTIARSFLPPPLLRVGEKLQPAWTFQFLRNPEKVRPDAVLRMPRFNMSDDEAMALVNYFGAVDKLKNPGIGLTSPYLTVAQREESYWIQLNAQYVKRLGPETLNKRKEEVQKTWDQHLKDRVAELERKIAVAKAEVEAAKGDDAKKKAEDNRTFLEKELKELKAGVDSKTLQGALLGEWANGKVYATETYRMVANSPCLSCHQVPSVMPNPGKYPALSLAPDRLRPDWAQRWIASPQRLLIYPEGPNPMPNQFPRNEKPEQQWWSNYFAGGGLEAATGIRDVIMDYPRLADMPANRYYRAAPGEGKK